MIPFVLATILVTVFSPWFHTINQWLRNKQTIAAIMTCAIVLALVLIPLGVLFGLLSKEAWQLFLWAKERIQTETVADVLANNPWISEQIATIQNTLKLDLGPENIKEQLSSVAKNIGFSIYTQARAITANIFTVILNFVLLIFILFYLFRDGDDILARIMKISPLTESQERHIIIKFQQVGRAVFWGNLVSAFLQGVMAGLGFIFFGLGNAILAGLATAISSLIPAIGTLLIYVPAAFYFFLTQQTLLGIAFIIYGIVFSNLIDNIIKPKFIETKIKVHPLLVFFSILGGVQVFGLLGILYGPVIVTIFLSLLEIYESDFQEKNT